MTIASLELVMWQLRNDGMNNPSNLDLRRAIMKHIGTDARTYRNNRKALIELGWIKAYNKSRVQLTNKDITDN